jgi:hypothetical protein
MKTTWKNRLLLLAVAPLLLVTFTATSAPSAPASATPARHSPFEKVDVGGDIATGGTFQGKLDVISFGQDATGALVANGLLTGVLKDANGHPLGSVTNEYVSLPAQLTTSGRTNAPSAVCPILHLTLGPLDLNLLGLTVHLNRVVLNLDAVSGPGNLLGNLLCAVAHLLDGGGALQQIIDLLNRIIDLASL